MKAALYTDIEANVREKHSWIVCFVDLQTKKKLISETEVVLYRDGRGEAKESRVGGLQLEVSPLFMTRPNVTPCFTSSAHSEPPGVVENRQVQGGKWDSRRDGEQRTNDLILITLSASDSHWESFFSSKVLADATGGRRMNCF